MKDFSNLEEWTPKKLRSLRMNLNNRIESFKKSEKPKELQKSHILYELGHAQCEELLLKVKKAEKKLTQDK